MNSEEFLKKFPECISVENKPKAMELAYAEREAIKRFTSLSNWSWVRADKDGYPVSTSNQRVRYVCYGSIRAATYQKSYYFITNSAGGELGRGLEEETALNFLQWFLNDSPWQHCFITKNPKDVLESGIICDCRFPSEYILQAGVALRHLQEYPLVINTWDAITQTGVSGDKAILLSLWHRKLGNRLVRNRVSSGHSLFGGINKSGIRRFIQHDFSAMVGMDPMYRSGGGYYFFDRPWQKDKPAYGADDANIYLPGKEEEIGNDWESIKMKVIRLDNNLPEIVDKMFKEKVDI